MYKVVVMLKNRVSREWVAGGNVDALKHTANILWKSLEGKGIIFAVDVVNVDGFSIYSPCETSTHEIETDLPADGDVYL